MKITTQQKESIREVLWHNLKYRETFEEFYDHILTGIEIYESSEKPHEVAHRIIHQEFGGWQNIKELEAEREKAIQRQFRQKLWAEVKSYFRFPFIMFTVFMAGGVYLAADMVSRKLIMVLLFVAVMVPAFMWYLIAPFNRWSKKYKPSVKERSAEYLGSFGLSLFNMLLFLPAVIASDKGTKYLLYVHASLLTVVAIVLIIYSLSAIKVFQQNLKTSLAS
jgi:hypothetical protein